MLSWLPLAAIIIAQFAWVDVPRTLTTHWNFSGTPDSRGTLSGVFWDFAPPAAILALVVTALVVTVGGDISRRGGAAGIGLVSWFLGTLAGIWFVIRLVAIDPSRTGIYTTSLVVAGLLFGGLTGGAVALPRHHAGERSQGRRSRRDVP